MPSRPTAPSYDCGDKVGFLQRQYRRRPVAPGYRAAAFRDPEEPGVTLRFRRDGQAISKAVSREVIFRLGAACGRGLFLQRIGEHQLFPILPNPETNHGGELR